MTDTATPDAAATANAAAYRGVRERVTALVGGASPPDLDAIAAATPEWRARDVFAHVVGVATDIVSGNIADAAADHWTAAQVEARRDLPVAALVDEWADAGRQVEAIILAVPTAVSGQIVADAVTHEHDLRHALGRPGARDSDALTIGVAWIIAVLGRMYDDAGDPAIRFESEVVAATAGTGAVDTTVRASTFELARAIVGRRTVAEIAAYDWTPTPCPERLLVLPLFTPRAVSLGE